MYIAEMIDSSANFAEPDVFWASNQNAVPKEAAKTNPLRQSKQMTALWRRQNNCASRSARPTTSSRCSSSLALARMTGKCTMYSPTIPESSRYTFLASRLNGLTRLEDQIETPICIKVPIKTTAATCQSKYKRTAIGKNTARMVGTISVRNNLKTLMVPS